MFYKFQLNLFNVNANNNRSKVIMQNNILQKWRLLFFLIFLTNQYLKR